MALPIIKALGEHDDIGALFDEELFERHAIMDCHLYTTKIFTFMRSKPIFSSEIMLRRLRRSFTGWRDEIYLQDEYWFVYYPKVSHVITGDRNALELSAYPAIKEFTTLKEIAFAETYDPQTNIRRDEILRYIMHLPEPVIPGVYMSALVGMAGFSYHPPGSRADQCLYECMQLYIWLLPKSSRKLLKDMVEVFHKAEPPFQGYSVAVGKIFAPIFMHDCTLALAFSVRDVPKYYSDVVAFLKYLVDAGTGIFKMPNFLRQDIVSFLISKQLEIPVQE